MVKPYNASLVSRAEYIIEQMLSMIKDQRSMEVRNNTESI